MVDAAQPPNMADIEAQYDLHRAKREQQMEKLEVEVAEMRAEQALQAQLELEVKTVMPPRERAARERQLRQEAAETRRIAEAEEEAARIAASNGGVVRRNPDGGHGEGTLAARNAANILAQLLGPHELHKALMGELKEVVAWAWAQAWQIHARQPASGNLDPDAKPQAHPRAPPPELESTDDSSAAPAAALTAPYASATATTAAVVLSTPPQTSPSSLEGDSIAGADARSSNSSSLGSSSGGGGAFAIWALRRQVFRAFRASEAGKARTILLRQPRQQHRAVLARQKRSGGVNLELQSRIVRQIRVRHFLRVVIAAEFRLSRASKLHADLRDNSNNSRSGSRDGTLRTVSRSRGGSRDGNRNGGARGRSSSRGSSRDRKVRSSSHPHRRLGSPSSNRDSPSRETRSRRRNRCGSSARSVDFEVTCEPPARRISSPQSPHQSRPLSPASPYSFHSTSPRSGGSLSPKSLGWGFNTDDAADETPPLRSFKATGPEAIAAAEAALTEAAAALATLQRSSLLDASPSLSFSSSFLGPGEIAWGLLRCCLASLGSQRPVKDSSSWRGVIIIESSPDGKIKSYNSVNGSNGSTNSSVISSSSSSSGLDQGKRRGSHKSKSQHEHNTKSRAKKVVRGISSEQIGLIQEVAASANSADSASSIETPNKDIPSATSSTPDTTILGRRRYAGDNIGWVVGPRAVNVASLARWRGLVTVEQDMSGQKRMQPLLEEKLRLEATARCVHPAHLPGLTCVHCGLVQPPAVNSPAHKALAAAVAAGKNVPVVLEARYPSALIDGRRRLHCARELMDFLVHELATRSTDGEVAKQVAENARAKLLHPAANFLQQAWRLRLASFLAAVQSARLEESAEASTRRRQERLIRDVRYGDHTLARYAPPQVHLFRKPLQLRAGSKQHSVGTTTKTAGGLPLQRDSRGEFIAAAGVAVEAAVETSCTDARAPGSWSGTAPWVRENFGVGLCRRADPAFLLQACKKEGMRSAIALHKAAVNYAAGVKQKFASRPVTGEGSRATSPLKDKEATTPRVATATGMGGRRGGMTRAALEARYGDLTPKGLLDNFIAFEHMRTTLAGTRAVKQMVGWVKARYGARAAARLAEEKKAAEAAMAKLEAQRRRAEAAAKEAGLSVEAHALELKREAQAVEKARIERRLANMAHAANASHNSKECFYCRRPECCKPKLSSVSNDQLPEAHVDPAFVRAGAVSKQALAAAKDAATLVPRVFTDARQFQIHIRWHEREDRAEIEAAREKAEVIAARQKAEDEFLAATKQARAARVVEEKRWAAADKAVMAEEFAAALGANEVPGLDNYRDLAIEALPTPHQRKRQDDEERESLSFSPPPPLLLPESSIGHPAQPPAPTALANHSVEEERVHANRRVGRRRPQGSDYNNDSDLAKELALALESPRLPSPRRSSDNNDNVDDDNNGGGSDPTSSGRRHHHRSGGLHTNENDSTTSSSSISSNGNAGDGLLAVGMRNERFGHRARRRTVAADAAARKAAEMRNQGYALIGPAVAGLSGDVSASENSAAGANGEHGHSSSQMGVTQREQSHEKASGVISSGDHDSSGIGVTVGRGETAGAPGFDMNEDSSDESDDDDYVDVNDLRRWKENGSGTSRRTKEADARRQQHRMPEEEALEDRAARKRFAAKQQRHVWTPAAALHSQAAALNREELEEEASKRLEGGEDGADLDRRAYMLLASPSFSSSRGATNSHDILAAEAHERALSLAVGSVARRPGHQAASAAANGGSAYQTDQLAKLDALLQQQQQKHVPGGDLAVNLKIHRARVTTAAAAVSAGPSLARLHPGARHNNDRVGGSDNSDDDSDKSSAYLGHSVIRKSRRSNMKYAVPRSGAAPVMVTRAPVPLPLPPHELPYLELTHSALLPTEDNHSIQGESENEGGSNSGLLARRVVLGNVINRIGRNRICDVCIEGPLDALRNKIGLAADEIASHFSDVHALIRVDLMPGTNASADEAPSYAVSCYDHFAVSSSSSSSTSRSLSGSTSNDDGYSSSSGSAGVWLLGMTGGVRAAPQPLEFNKPDGPLRGRLKHGDSLMIASQQHGGGGGFSSGYQLVYRLVVPSAARSLAPRAQSAAVAIADLARDPSIGNGMTSTSISSSQDALDNFLNTKTTTDVDL